MKSEKGLISKIQKGILKIHKTNNPVEKENIQMTSKHVNNHH